MFLCQLILVVVGIVLPHFIPATATLDRSVTTAGIHAAANITKKFNQSVLLQRRRRNDRVEGGPPVKWATNRMLHKTQFSNTTRGVFVVGLGGTGHHAMQAIFQSCEAAGVCEDADYRQRLWNRKQPKDRLKRGLFNVKALADWTEGNTARAEETAESMRNFVRNSKQATSGGVGKMRIQVGNTLLQKETGYLSYPNFDKSSVARVMQPDAKLLAEIAEESGLDFRIVVLLRDPHDAAASVGDRFWHGCTKCIYKKGVHSFEMLLKQLRLLDNRFYTCTYLHQLHGFGETLDELLYPNVAKSPTGDKNGGSFATWVPDAVRRMSADDHKPIRTNSKQEASAEAIERENRLQEQLDKLCSRTAVKSALLPNATSDG